VTLPFIQDDHQGLLPIENLKFLKIFLRTTGWN